MYYAAINLIVTASAVSMSGDRRQIGVSGYVCHRNLCPRGKCD